MPNAIQGGVAPYIIWLALVQYQPPSPPYMGVGKPLVQVSIFLDIMCEFPNIKSPTLSFFGQIFGV